MLCKSEESSKQLPKEYTFEAKSGIKQIYDYNFI